MSNRFELQDYFGDKTIRGWGVYGKNRIWSDA